MDPTVVVEPLARHERPPSRRQRRRRRSWRRSWWGVGAAVIVLALVAAFAQWVRHDDQVATRLAPWASSSSVDPTPVTGAAVSTTESTGSSRVSSSAPAASATAAPTRSRAASAGTVSAQEALRPAPAPAPVVGAGPVLRTPARGYYVSCTRGDDGADGSSGRPWRSLRRVQSHVFTADSGLYLQRGCVWNEQLEIRGAGSGSAPVTVTSYGNGDRPTIRNAGEPGNSAIALLGDHMQLADVVVAGAPGYAVQLFGDHALVTRVGVRDSGLGIRVMGADALVDHVAVSNLHMVVSNASSNDDYGAVGFVVEGPRAEIRYSSCTGCRAPSHDYGFDGGFVEIWNHGDGLSVHDNTATNTEGFLEIGGDSSGASARSVTLTRNTLVDTHGGVFIHSEGRFGIAVSGIVFSKNSVKNRASSSNPVFGGDLSALTVDGNTIVANQPVAFEAPGRHLNNRFYADKLGFTPSSSETRRPYADAP